MNKNLLKYIALLLIGLFISLTLILVSNNHLYQNKDGLIDFITTPQKGFQLQVENTSTLLNDGLQTGNQNDALYDPNRIRDLAFDFKGTLWVTSLYELQQWGSE